MADSSDDSCSSVSSDDGPPFRFFDLPFEIRRQILDQLLVLDRTIDIHVRNSTTLSNALLVSQQFGEEAAGSFYGGNIFRILPTHPRAAHKTARPLLQDFSQWQRSRLVFLELRFGPFWTLPPRCWTIDGRLGLEEAILVRRLRVFVEVDPSLAVFNGFRSAKISYADFAANLLNECLVRLPRLDEVQFDAYLSASRGTTLIDRLVELARTAGKRISWGPNQRAIDKNREQMQANESGQPESGDHSNASRHGMIPFYGSSPLYRRSLPKSILS